MDTGWRRLGHDLVTTGVLCRERLFLRKLNPDSDLGERHLATAKDQLSRAFIWKAWPDNKGYPSAEIAAIS